MADRKTDLAFTLLDLDGDGELTREEFTRFTGAAHTGILQNTNHAYNSPRLFGVSMYMIICFVDAVPYLSRVG